MPESTPTDSTTRPHLQVSGRFLTSPGGERIVLRGVNEMFVWGDRAGNALEEIAKTGANGVRLVWTLADGTARELDALVSRCAALGMVPIAEFHDATGKWEELETVVSGWLRPDYLEVVRRHERYLVVNIGNEVGQEVSDSEFTDRYTDAIHRLRAADIVAPLMVDAAKWGQDYELLSRTGRKLVEADPLGNILLSIHMWWPAKQSGGSWQATVDRVVAALSDAQTKELPLVVGEFGGAFTEAGIVEEEDRIAWETILEECHKRDIGWFAWSWGAVPNKPQTDLDMSRDGTLEALRGWGREVVEHPKGIRATSKPVGWLASRVAKPGA